MWYNTDTNERRKIGAGYTYLAPNQHTKGSREMAAFDSTFDLPTTQKCSCCGSVLPLNGEHFYRTRRNNTGFHYTCITCTKAQKARYYATNRERLNSKRREQHSESPEKKRMQDREYRARNLELLRERDRARSASRAQQRREYNRARLAETYEKRSAYARQYRENNRDKLNAYAREYNRARQAIRSVYVRNRRARQRAADGQHTADDIKRMLDAQRGKCYYCKRETRDNYHVDHVVPLSRGGRNDTSNLVIACPTCNISKNDKLPHEWVEGGRLL